MDRSLRARPPQLPNSLNRQSFDIRAPSVRRRPVSSFEDCGPLERHFLRRWAAALNVNVTISRRAKKVDHRVEAPNGLGPFDTDERSLRLEWARPRSGSSSFRSQRRRTAAGSRRSGSIHGVDTSPRYDRHIRAGARARVPWRGVVRGGCRVEPVIPPRVRRRESRWIRYS
jgi:hypothetical protein